MKKQSVSNILPFLVLALFVGASFLSTVNAAADIQVAYYAFTNADDAAGLQVVHPSAATQRSYYGENFQMSTNAYITQFIVNLIRIGSPQGYVKAFLYNLTEQSLLGTTTDVLAESTTSYYMGDIPLIAANYTFAFNQTYQLVDTKWYGIVVQVVNGTVVDTSNYIKVALDTTSPGYTGNAISYHDSAAALQSTFDVVFEIWGNVDAAPEPTPTPEPTPPYWYTDEDITGLMGYLAILLIIGIPMFLLAVPFRMGANGAVVGLAIGAALGYLIYPTLMPLWLVFLIAIGIIGFFIRGFRS